jgi:hypothetical protein
MRVRTFSADVAEDELVWHRDKRDRLVEVLEGEGWKFQHEDELPFELNVDDIVHVEAMTYHRLLLGKSQLKLRITER